MPFSLIVAVWMIVALGAIALLSAAQAFFVPLLIAVTLAYILRPAVDALVATHLPRALAALAIVLATLGLIGGGIYALGDDAARFIETLPKAARAVRVALQDGAASKPHAIAKVGEVAREIDKAAAAAAGQSAPPQPAPAPPLGTRLQEYAVAQGMMLIVTLGQAIFVFILTWFLLSEGDTFKRKLVRMAGPSLSRQKTTVRILEDVDRQVQRQMGAMVLANVLLGICVAVVFGLIGVELAVLWGVVAGLLHFIPYLGQAIVTAMSSAAAYVQFGTLGAAAGVACATLAVAIVIGVLLQAWLSARVARVNATVLFIAMLFFGWLWGAWGLVLAAPIVAIAKSVADNVEAFAPASVLFSDRQEGSAEPSPVA